MKRSSLLIALSVLLLLTVDLYAASTVRGRLYREANGRTYPAPDVSEQIRDYGRSASRIWGLILSELLVNSVSSI